jgi:hypothetical protein
MPHQPSERGLRHTILKRDIDVTIHLGYFVTSCRNEMTHFAREEPRFSAGKDKRR